MMAVTSLQHKLRTQTERISKGPSHLTSEQERTVDHLPSPGRRLISREMVLTTTNIPERGKGSTKTSLNLESRSRKTPKKMTATILTPMTKD
jgi:hypothetical protein